MGRRLRRMMGLRMTYLIDVLGVRGGGGAVVGGVYVKG